MKIYELESVGTVIDENGVTYPMLANGQPDWDQGMELTRVDAGEWWERLSGYDKTTALHVWYVAKKVWWDHLSLSEPATEEVVAELRKRASDIRMPGPPMLVDMFRIGYRFGG